MLFSPLPASATPEIIAHRGFAAQAPENTVASFRLGWEKGADSCELDIHLTSDQQMVVIHDADTMRVAGEKKVVKQTSLAELRSLDVGSWKGAQWKGEKIPTLAEALATMPAGPRRFFLEIKSGPEVVAPLQKLLEPMRARAAQLVIISFHREACVKAKQVMPWLKVFLLASGKKDKQPRTDLAQVIADTRKDGLDGVNLGDDWPWDAAMVKQIRDAGLGLYVWTVDDAEKARKLAALGVDGITTNDPPRIRKALAAP